MAVSELRQMFIGDMGVVFALEVVVARTVVMFFDTSAWCERSASAACGSSLLLNS